MQTSKGTLMRAPIRPQNNNKKRLVKSAKAVFPSYSELHTKIMLNQSEKNQQKIQNLETKIERIKNTINFQQQHQKMRHKMIQLEKNKKDFYYLNKEEVEDQITESQKYEYHEILLQQILGMQRYSKYYSNRAGGRYLNVESLNEYIENDDSLTNNRVNNYFENSLKFRKKALLRELQKDQSGKDTNEDKRQYQEFFKNLFSSSTQFHKVPQTKRKHQTKAKLINGRKDINLRLNKENEMIAQNRQRLKNQYKQFIDALLHTNIVKLRILNNNSHEQLQQRNRAG